MGSRWRCETLRALGKCFPKLGSGSVWRESFPRGLKSTDLWRGMDGLKPVPFKTAQTDPLLKVAGQLSWRRLCWTWTGKEEGRGSGDREEGEDHSERSD